MNQAVLLSSGIVFLWATLESGTRLYSRLVLQVAILFDFQLTEHTYILLNKK